MKQVYLLLSLILASLATAQYSSGDLSGRLASGSSYGSYAAPAAPVPSSYSAPSAPSSYSAPASPPSYSPPAPYSPPASPPSYSAPASPPSYSAPASPPSYSAPASPPSYSARTAPTYSAPAAPVVSYAPKSISGPGYATTSYAKPSTSYGSSSSSYGSTGGSYGSSGNSYGSTGGSYGYQPTGQPYGIQSTGEYSSYNYQQEPLDISKCGPPPSSNPCTAYGPQYYPLPGNPYCYIQCAFERLFVKPCPANLVWNPRINVCDWPTVASYGGDSSYGSGSSYGGGSSYSAPPAKDSSSYSYGRKRRTVERKKRQLLPVPPIPLGAPILPFGLPGPISFGGPLGFPGLGGPLGFPGLGGPLGGFPGLGGPLGMPTPFFFPQRRPEYKSYDYNDYDKDDYDYGKKDKSYGKKYSSYDNDDYDDGYYSKDMYNKKDKYDKYDDGYYSKDLYNKKDKYDKYDDSYYGKDTYYKKNKYDKYDDGYYSKDLYSNKDKYDDDYYGKDSYNKKDNYGDDYDYSYSKKDKYTKKDKSYDDDYDSKSYKKDKYNKKDSYSHKNYNSYDSYDDDDDYYGYSKKSKYTLNGNFKPSYHKKHSSYGYDDDYSYGDNDYSYRKKRQYNYQGETEMKALLAPTAVPEIPFEIVSLCAGKNNGENVPHPSDVTKYIACTSSEKPDIMDCPTGLIYDVKLDRCEEIKKTELLCESQPCLNDGKCHQTGPTTFQCTCLSGWTGERCETPLSSCASNPCGLGNACHSLKTKDYPQDYVCLCNERQFYGLTCEQNTVPNPCLATTGTLEQYHPFAFSSHAFIQCNGDLLYVQPCAAGLVWDQETKVCDIPMSPPTPVAPAPVPVTFADQPAGYQVASGTELKPANVLPTISFADEPATVSNGYGSMETKSFVKSNEETHSSYGSSHNRIFRTKDTPSYSTFFNPLPTLPNARIVKHKMITPGDFIPTSHSRSFAPAQSNYAQPMQQKFTSQIREFNHKTQDYGNHQEKFFRRTEQYGQDLPAQPFPPMPPSIPRSFGSDAYATAINSYSQPQPERVLVPHLPKTLPKPIIQLEPTRTSYGSTSGGY